MWQLIITTVLSWVIVALYLLACMNVVYLGYCVLDYLLPDEVAKEIWYNNVVPDENGE